MDTPQRTEWDKFQVHDPLNVSRRLDVDMSTYDPGPLEYEYTNRLLKFSENIKKQLPNQPGAYEVHKRLIENAPGLMRGETNFSSNMGRYLDPRVRLYSMTHDQDKPDPRIEAMIRRHRPHEMFINAPMNLTSSENVLGHESIHVGHEILTNRALNDNSKNRDMRQYDWDPQFSTEFMKAAAMLRAKPDSPYQFKHGFGRVDTDQTNPDVNIAETMAYLVGREADLPSGQTLMDDSSTNFLFKNHPGMYERYLQSKQKLQDTWLGK